MGFLDNVTNTFNRGAAAADRTTRSLKLKGQLSDIAKRRQELATQLGASLYEVTKENAELRAGREPLYDGIAQCDMERAEVERMLAAIEAEANAAAAAPLLCVASGRGGVGKTTLAATMAALPSSTLYCMRG